MGEKFGIPEMREFATAHGDQRVYLIWLRLNEARTKNALWCSETVKLRAEVERLREEARWRKWPEEKPEQEKPHLVMLSPNRGDGGRLLLSIASYWCECWLLEESGRNDDVTGRVKYYRPIGELPKEKTEAGGAG